MASLKLAKLKLSRSICFGDAVLSGFEDHLQKHPQLGTTNYATNVFNQTTSLDKTVSLYSLDDVRAKYKLCTYKNGEGANEKIQLNSARSNEEVVEEMCSDLRTCTLNIGHVVVDESELEEQGGLGRIDDWSRRVFECSPTPGLNLVIFTGSGSGGNGLCFIKLKRL